jgi:hypothetical protein
MDLSRHRLSVQRVRNDRSGNAHQGDDQAAHDRRPNDHENTHDVRNTCRRLLPGAKRDRRGLTARSGALLLVVGEGHRFNRLGRVAT